MTTITSLDLCTVPLTEEGVERYKISDPVSNHLTSLFNYSDDLNCSVGRIFNKVKIPVSWIAVNAANYIKATMEFNNPSGSTLQIYGWIDAVDPISDTDGYAAVEVKWHFDYWEMYKSSMTFGYGHIKRRPFGSLSDTPIQNYPVRYYAIDGSPVRVDPNMKTATKQIWWAYISYNSQSGGHTSIETRAFPVSVPPGIGLHLQINEGGVNKTVQALSLPDIYSGKFDEIFGIDPDDVIGAWISPYYPSNIVSFSGSGDFGDPLIFVHYAGVPNYGESSSISPSFGWMYASPTVSYPAVTFNPPLVSSEEVRHMLVSPEGLKLLELPYGFSVSSLNVTLIFENDAPFLEFTFRSGSYGNLEGMTVNLPLSCLPVNSNAYSSYVYSGRQDYDRSMRTVRSNADAWKSSAAGAGSGAMMGAFGPAGLVVGSVGGTIGGLVGYGVEMGYQNDAEQQLENRLQANQPSTMIVSSNSRLAIFREYGFSMMKIVPDSYSAAQLTNVRSNSGVSVDEILSSCDTQIRTTAPTGYYRIDNMIITGSVPKEAKDYVKKKFASGVKLL